MSREVPVSLERAPGSAGCHGSCVQRAVGLQAAKRGWNCWLLFFSPPPSPGDSTRWICLSLGGGLPGVQVGCVGTVLPAHHAWGQRGSTMTLVLPARGPPHRADPFKGSGSGVHTDCAESAGGQQGSMAWTGSSGQLPVLGGVGTPTALCLRGAHVFCSRHRTRSSERPEGL